MYPELEKASEFFTKKINADKSRNHTNETLLKIEQETINMFNLSDKYQITSQSEEQSKRIENRSKQTINKLENNAIEDLNFPVLKTLAHAMKKTENDAETTSKAIDTLDKVSSILRNGEEKSIKKRELLAKHPQFNKYFDIADQLFAMQKNNVLDKDMNITDSKKFLNSDLVKNFTIDDKTFDLSKKLQQTKKDSKLEI